MLTLLLDKVRKDGGEREEVCERGADCELDALKHSTMCCEGVQKAMLLFLKIKL